MRVDPRNRYYCQVLDVLPSHNLRIHLVMANYLGLFGDLQCIIIKRFFLSAPNQKNKGHQQ